MTLLLFSPDVAIARTIHESFVDENAIESKAGLTLAVNKPVKYVANPVFEAQEDADDWDYGKTIVDVVQVGENSYRLYYSAAEDAPTAIRRIAVATSTDGLAWTKPNAGIVTFDGNSNNNLVIDQYCTFPSVNYDATRVAAQRYIMTTERKPGSLNTGLYIWVSADGITWTLHHTVTDAALRGESIEAKDFMQLPDGRWLVYYTMGQNVDQRRTGAYRSATSSLTSEWTDLGTLIPYVAQDADQPYALGVHPHGDTYYGFLAAYNLITDRIDMDLYASRDGLAWTKLDNAWIPVGAGGAWDDEIIFPGKTLLRMANEWWFYYAGLPEPHEAANPRASQIGLAKVGYERITQIGTTGTFITTVIAAYYGSKLYVNAEAVGGELTVEVLGAVSDVPRTGYAEADCDPITSDTYATEVTWGGESLPATRPIRLKFHLTNATLYSYRVEVA